MSFILDALRKADETRHQATPSILGKLRVPKPVSQRAHWPWILGGAVLLAVNAGVIAYVVWPGAVAVTARLEAVPETAPAKGEVTTPAAAPKATEVTAPAAASKAAEVAAPAAAPKPAEVTAPTVGSKAAEVAAPAAAPKPAEVTAQAAAPKPVEVTAPTAAPKPAEVTAPAAAPKPADRPSGVARSDARGAAASSPPLDTPLTPPGSTTRPAPPVAPNQQGNAPATLSGSSPASSIRPAPAPAPTQAAVPPAPPTAALTPPRPALAPQRAEPSVPPNPPASAVPSGGGDELSKLKLTVHVWADKPGERLVFINGRKYVQGDRIEDKALLEEITQEGALVSYEGRRSLLRP
jgi:Type II secretion system protein B